MRFSNRRQIYTQIQMMKSLLKREFTSDEIMPYHTDRDKMLSLFNKLRAECKENGLLK